MADEVRMRRTLAHIENNLDLWDQNGWVTKTSCGTAYCYAGWAVVLEGISIQVDEEPNVVYVHRYKLPQSWRDRLEALDLGYLHGTNYRVAVSDMAALILGLYDGRRRHDKWALFGACLTLDNLRESVDRVCSGKDAVRGEIRVRAGQANT